MSPTDYLTGWLIDYVLYFKYNLYLLPLLNYFLSLAWKEGNIYSPSIWMNVGCKNWSSGRALSQLVARAFTKCEGVRFVVFNKGYLKVSLKKDSEEVKTLLMEIQWRGGGEKIRDWQVAKRKCGRELVWEGVMMRKQVMWMLAWGRGE